LPSGYYYENGYLEVRLKMMECIYAHSLRYDGTSFLHYNEFATEIGYSLRIGLPQSLSGSQPCLLEALLTLQTSSHLVCSGY
jgi:hypothetical protein